MTAAQDTLGLSVAAGRGPPAAGRRSPGTRCWFDLTDGAAQDFPFDPDLLRHVSPIEWKNVVLYGEIKIDPAKLKMRGP